MVSHGDALVEGLHDGELHDASQFGLSGEDEDKGVEGIHFEVSQEAKLLERAGFKEVGLVDHKQDGFSCLLFGFQDVLLNLLVDGALTHSLLQAEETVDVVEEVGAAESGKGGVEGFEEVFVEGVDETPESDGFAHAGLTG